MNNTHSGGESEAAPPAANSNGPASGETAAPKQREQKPRQNRLPPIRRNDTKPKEALVNGTTA